MGVWAVKARDVVRLWIILLGNLAFVYFAGRAFIPWWQADFEEFLARAKTAMIFWPFPPLLYYELFMRKEGV